MGCNIKRLLIFFFIAAFSIIGQGILVAQPHGSDWLAFKNLDIQPHLPKYLLSRKSVVFVITPRSSSDSNLRGDWKQLSEKVHGSLRKMKIDAIAYYYLDDLFANHDVNSGFAKEMEKREVKYVIVVEQGDNNEAGVGSYSITISAFNDKGSIISEGQKAWRIEGPDLEVLLDNMRKDVFRSEMKLENYLVPDIPEFFTATKLLKAKRIPTYAKDLKVDKLVVPRFRKYQVEDSSALNETVLKKIQSYNSAVDIKNRRLEVIMKGYPLPYVISDSYTDTDIYNEGHQFVLTSLESTGKNIRAMLDYEIDPNETDYVTIRAGSTLNTLSVEAIVVKYYVKHVYTKDVYLGSRWDADLTWEEALENFIFHMKDVLKVK